MGGRSRVKADDGGETASAPAEGAAPSKTVSTDSSDDTQAPLTVVATKKPPTGVVKKIVEADDDDPEPSAPSAGSAKRNARGEEQSWARAERGRREKG